MPLLTDGEINDFIREIATKEEFCLNSRRWIIFMMIEPPTTCPYAETKFWECDQCPYYQLRQPTKYFKKKKKILEEWEKGMCR